jgi:hypothetical protein
MDAAEELERLKSEFRAMRLAARWETIPDGATTAAATKMREFCVTSGQDLATLDAFVREVEEEVQSFLPM